MAKADLDEANRKRKAHLPQAEFSSEELRYLERQLRKKSWNPSRAYFEAYVNDRQWGRGNKSGKNAERDAGIIGYHRAKKHLRAKGLGNVVVLRFRNLATLAKALGRNAKSADSRNSVRRSLELWSRLEIQHGKWLVEKGQRQRGFLKPVIAKLSLPNGPRQDVEVAMSGKYLDTLRGYSAKLTLPLPVSSDQGFNLFLWMQAFNKGGPGAMRRIGYEKLLSRIDLRGDHNHEVGRQFNRTLDRLNIHVAPLGFAYDIEPEGTYVKLTRKPTKSKATKTGKPHAAKARKA